MSQREAELQNQLSQEQVRRERAEKRVRGLEKIHGASVMLEQIAHAYLDAKTGAETWLGLRRELQDALKMFRKAERDAALT